jgi:hypothetical protein
VAGEATATGGIAAKMLSVGPASANLYFPRVLTPKQKKGNTGKHSSKRSIVCTFMLLFDVRIQPA